MHDLSRRQYLRGSACGFGSLALAGICAERAASDTRVTARHNPLGARAPHHAPAAKRVIFLWMQGGPSQVDTFDPKPALTKYDGRKVELYNPRTLSRQPERIMKELWEFKRHGECGQPVSALFPHIARHVDDLCFIRSMHTEGAAHGPASLFMHTGATNLIRPSVGAWVSYGLGTENHNLPAFVTVSPPMTRGGARNWGNAFLPPVYQGTAVGRAGVSSRQARFRFLTNERLSETTRREQFDFLRRLNRIQSDQRGIAGSDAEIEAAIESYELAFRMQAQAPEVMDISSESEETLELYGLNETRTEDFGRQCLLARRLCESGVRFVQVNYADNSATPRWDQHGNMSRHMSHAAATDKPVAALLTDLKRRGLLEDTLVWWGGEFGRTPFAQGKNGRDHNPAGFTVFLAGGGVKAGHAHGETDEFGHNALTNKVHMHDLHATILHLMGLDHERLTYRYAGRDFRLTDVYGQVVHDIIA